MAAIETDFKVEVNGDIRYIGDEHGGSDPGYYTVLALHRFLQGLADDATASGDDLLDITDATPSERSTDNIITLINGYNIDDLASEHLYDGSITQGTGATEVQYSGIVIVGAVNNSATELVVVQDNNVLPNYWGTVTTTPENLKDSTQNILLRTLIKTRFAGRSVDAKKVRVQARHLGDTSAEFSATLGLGNSTAAIFTNNDLNDGGVDATIAAYTGITNTEGYQGLDLLNGNGTLFYYSQWNFNYPTDNINKVYEWAKHIQQRPPAEDSGTDTGTAYTIDDADSTRSGIAQSFTSSANLERITKAIVSIRKASGDLPTGPIWCEIHGNSGGVPDGTAVAYSETFEASDLTETYQDIEFVFNSNSVNQGQASGSYQSGNQQVSLTASTTYHLVIQHPDGVAGTGEVEIEGAVAGADGASEYSGASWGDIGGASDALQFAVHSSPDIHSMAGELFRGITHQIDYDNETAPFSEDEIITWGTSFDYSSGSGTFIIGEKIIFSGSGAVGTLLYNSGTTTGTMVVSIGAGTVVDTDTPTGDISGATANIDTATVADTAAIGGTGVLLALDDNGTDGVLWIQLLTGSAPVENLPLYGRDSDGNALTDASIITRTISPCFLGTSTGSALIGAYGIGFLPADLTSSDRVTPLNGTQETPPNNVTFTVGSLVVGDRVLVGPEVGDDYDYGQAVTTTANLSATNESQVTVGDGTEDFTPIPTDTPASGTIRIETDAGIYRRVAYASFTGSVFTFSAPEDFSSDNATIGNNVFVSYIDAAAGSDTIGYTAQYSSDRDLRVRVRDGGGTPIKTFESNATFGSANSTLNAIRTSDA